MVAGLDRFKAFFADYRDCYVLIGGSACDVYFAENDIAFRVTHDLDMVLCVEALTPAFFERFWQFIREGGYEHRQKADGSRQFYRFSHPMNPGYPAMLELFSRKADFIPEIAGGHLTPIPAGEEASSLSGIMLNRAYYDFVMANRTIVDGASILTPFALMVMKAVAWLDLTEKREQGDVHAYSKDIQKHKNDIARLSVTLAEEHYEKPKEIADRMREFLSRYKLESLDLRALGLGGLTQEQVFARIEAIMLG